MRAPVGRVLQEQLEYSIVRLEAANLVGAHLEGANLEGAQMDGAELAEAHLEGTDLSKVKGLTQKALDSAHGDERTHIPVGLQRPKHWLNRK